MKQYQSLVMAALNAGYVVHRLFWNQKGQVEDFELLEANEAFEKLAGVEEKELLGKRLSQVMPTKGSALEDWMRVYPFFLKQKKWQTPQKMRMYFEKKRQYLCIKSIFIRPDLLLLLFSICCEKEDLLDYSDKLKFHIESELRSKEKLLANLPGMAYRCAYDRDWTMEYVSQGCKDLTGYPPEALIGNRKISYNDLVHPDYRDYLWEKWSEAVKNHHSVREEYPIITAASNTLWVLEQGHGVYDDQGEIEALEGLIIDISTRKELELSLQFQSDHDILTGLYNRRYYERAKEVMDKEENYPLSVVLGDINGLKLVNDAFGHVQGDRLIIEMADLLHGLCRERDVLARTGGDEFSMLLPNTDEKGASAFIKRVQEACKQANKGKLNHGYGLHIALGSDTKYSGESSLTKVEKSAEDRMYREKIKSHVKTQEAIVQSMKEAVVNKKLADANHAERVKELALELGQRFEFKKEEMEILSLLSLVHDVGKVALDDEILLKKELLNSDDWLEAKKSPEIGYRIALANEAMAPVAEYILAQQERWDGGGYPRGLSGESIPLFSRILAVVHAFDIMTHDNPYKKAVSREEAIEELRMNAGSQFDPAVCEVFLEMLRRKQGSIFS